MIVKAKRTLKNMHGTVLFEEGRMYQAEETPERIYIKNEIQSETLVHKKKLANDFDVIVFTGYEDALRFADERGRGWAYDLLLLCGPGGYGGSLEEYDELMSFLEEADK